MFLFGKGGGVHETAFGHSEHRHAFEVYPSVLVVALLALPQAFAVAPVVPTEPAAGAVLAVGIAFILRGPGGGFAGTTAAQGKLGWLWRPGPIDSPVPATPEAATAHDDGMPGRR